MVEIKLQIFEEATAGNSGRFTELFERARKVLAKRLNVLLKEGLWAVNLIITDDKRIQELNRDFRHKDKPTDVLSFPYLAEGVVGEIFVAMGVARKQAKEKGHPLEKELEILFVHGLLHLLGFDHNNDEEEAEMEMWAKKILL